MPIETIEFKGKLYPAFQSNGHASRFCMPFAKEVCKGIGFDIGYCKEEWKFPGSIGIDPAVDPMFNALNLPRVQVDYVFSSHCLEHVNNWVDVIEHWMSRLRQGGVVFLYLPGPTQEYWKPWNNRKHFHAFSPELMKEYFTSCGGFRNVFVSGMDAYDAFTVMAEKV